MAQGVAGALLGGVVLGAWRQVLEMLAGRTAYALWGFWGAVALGAAAGALVVYGVNRKVRWNAGCAAVAFFVLGVWLVVQLTLEETLRSGWNHFLWSANRSFAMYLWMIAKTAGLTVLVPAVLVGCVVQGGWREAGRGGRAVGWVLVLGGLWVAGFLCAWRPPDELMWRSPEVLTRMAALGFGILAGVSVLRKCGQMSGAWLFSGVFPLGVIVCLVVALLPREWRNPLSADGVFGRLACRDSGFGMGVPVAVWGVKGHTVVQYADADYGAVVALDGRSLILGNRFAAARTLTGYAPWLVRPDAEKAALLGAESGVYRPFFKLPAEAVATDAPRKLMALGAGLGTAKTKNAPQPYRRFDPRGAYDIIFIAPEPGWVRGSARAYSQAALRRYRKALSAEGVVALRVDGRALSEERFAAVARDFMAVFPGVQVWNVGAADWVLVGAKHEITVAMDGMAELLARDDVFADWLRAGNMGLPEILACMVCDAEGLGKWLEGRGAESARAARWRAPKRVIAGEHLLAVSLEPVRQPGTGWVLPGEMDEDIYAGVMERVGEARDARCLMVRALASGLEGRQEESLAAMRVAAKVAHRDALLLQMVDQLDLDARRRVRFGDFRGGQTCYEALIALSGGAARYHHGMGVCVRASGDWENAYRHFARAVGASPEQEAYRIDLAQAALAVGEFAEADRQYREVLARDPDNAEVHLLFAQALTAQKRPDKDFGQAVKLAERACELTQWQNNRLAYALADIYIEAGQVLEGVGLKRRLKEQGGDGGQF